MSDQPNLFELYDPGFAVVSTAVSTTGLSTAVSTTGSYYYWDQTTQGGLTQMQQYQSPFMKDLLKTQQAQEQWDAWKQYQYTTQWIATTPLVEAEAEAVPVEPKKVTKVPSAVERPRRKLMVE